MPLRLSQSRPRPGQPYRMTFRVAHSSEILPEAIGVKHGLHENTAVCNRGGRTRFVISERVLPTSTRAACPAEV